MGEAAFYGRATPAARWWRPCFFPASLDASVRQKARWVHGIAFQAWDRLGWTARAIDIWMSLRDRQGPLTALVLAAAYLLVMLEGALLLASAMGFAGTEPPPEYRLLVAITFATFAWRTVWRVAFTAREYGVAEGLRSIVRIPIANFIAILAGRRALTAYLRSLAGAPVSWDKTAHDRHPATSEPMAWTRRHAPVLRPTPTSA